MRRLILILFLIALFSEHTYSIGLNINYRFSKSKLTSSPTVHSNFRLHFYQEKIPVGGSGYKQIINGYLYGFLFAGAGALLSTPFVGDNFENIAIPFQVGLVGFVFGSAFGVYNSGTDSFTDASFSATLLGSLIGTALFIVPAPFGALLGFNYTKKDRQKYSSISRMEKNSFIKIAQFSFPL